MRYMYQFGIVLTRSMYILFQNYVIIIYDYVIILMTKVEISFNFAMVEIAIDFEICKDIVGICCLFKMTTIYCK